MKSVVFTLKNQLGDFTKKEKQVARFIIKYPQVVIDSNAKQVADQVGTSAATVIRLAKRVCKNGLPELKERLKNETMVNNKFFEEIDPADTLEVMKQKMEYRINHTIEQTNRTV
ncbi:MurR/RpiR family transcriptional regulator, partial [Pediococcus acidilactici]